MLFSTAVAQEREEAQGRGRAMRKALLSEVFHVCRSLEIDASALGCRVQSAYWLLARRPRPLVLVQAL
jgi:hypothetical protein